MGNYRLICVLFLLVISGLPSAAQQAFYRRTIEGRLSALQGAVPAELSIEVLTEGRIVERTDAAQDGSFMLRNLDMGRYEIRVVNGRGDVVRTDLVDVGSHTGQIDLRVPGISQDRPASGTVSLRALAKPTPKKVRKALERSQKAFAKGDVQGSIDQLLKALKECPDCPEVHNNLGVRYMKLNVFDKAEMYFSKTVELDPDSATGQTNLALVLVTLKDFPRAEVAARKALDLDAGSVPARYALGLIALSRRKCTDEALHHLQAAASAYPRAHLSAASMLVCKGQTDGAISELTAYLDTPNAEHKDRVETWRSELRKGQAE